ncbi:hypothetical protein FPQ18DRAFT_386114 [Pyronema domesticum]|nr:hypothetical protein FPQ18DRAFT_386114 [Pyronema domesticum]
MHMQFKESSRGTFPITVKSDRYVNIMSKCEYSPIISGQAGINMSSPVITDVGGNGTRNQIHPWLEGLSRKGLTVYVNPYAKLNYTERMALGNFTWDDEKYYCGPRCGYTLIYRFLHREEDWSLTKRPHGDFWNCTTEVSEMR